MFNIIHSYMPECWEGLVKKGFIDDTTGVKITQHFLTENQNKFNEVAKVGGNLHEIIRECKRTFYVDRLQGGTRYLKYDFDKNLVNIYKDMLGDRFLGFQMHEWASNYATDWYHIRKALGENPVVWTEEAIEKGLKKEYPFPYSILQQQTPYELSLSKRPETKKDFLRNLTDLFSKRMNEMDGMLLPANSYLGMIKLELDFGIHSNMPEIGACMPYTRVQIALVRGMSKAGGITWGAYYEPWGGKPFGVCYYKKDEVNEWNIRSSDHLFTLGGENGGSSRALQNRIFHYAFLSGASYLSEEWGMCNTFYDWKSFDITPYGKVKKDFLSFTSKNKDLGKPHIPFALVLPDGHEILDFTYLAWHDTKYIEGVVLLTDEEQKNVNHVRNVLRLIYGEVKSVDEAQAMTNSEFSDSFDIIYESSKSAFSNYKYLIDLSYDSKLKNKYKNLNIIETKDLEGFKVELSNIMKNELPCMVEGNIHWLLNKKQDKWILSIFNNQDVNRTDEKGEEYLKEKNIRTKVTFKNAPDLKIIYGKDSDLEKIDENAYMVEIESGNLVILEFRG